MEKRKLEEPCLTKMPLIVTKVICRWSLNDFLPRKILHFATSARQGISLLNLSGLRVEISRFHKEELRWGNLWPNFRARSLNLSNTTLSFSLLEHRLFMTVYASVVYDGICCSSEEIEFPDLSLCKVSVHDTVK